MINPRELRIGNYLLDWQKDVVTVRFIERRIACLHANKALVPYEPEQLSPVFINEGWFKKFGFIRQWDEVEGEIEEWKKDEFIYHDKDHLSFGGYHIFPDVDILYVHQLQNIFFDLTGKDL